MFALDLPWWLLALPLPLLVFYFLPPYREPQAAVQAPFFRDTARALGKDPQAGAVILRRNRIQHLLAPLVWTLVVLAAAQPVWIEDPIVEQVAGRDLCLVVDLSGSMETEDFENAEGAKTTRLDAVKEVVGGFVDRREGDRIALVVFGTAAYLQAPFTMDRAIVRELLDATVPRMAGPQTMLGDAIGYAIPRFDESESKQRVLLLLTDGNDTGSRMPPPRAAAIAARHGITIHTIAVGDPTTVGESAIDMDALAAIAKATKGRTFEARDREALEEVYATLDELEPSEMEIVSYRPRRPLFALFLGVAMAAVLLYHLGLVLRDRTQRRGGLRG